VSECSCSKNQQVKSRQLSNQFNAFEAIPKQLNNLKVGDDVEEVAINHVVLEDAHFYPFQLAETSVIEDSNTTFLVAKENEEDEENDDEEEVDDDDDYEDEDIEDEYEDIF